MVPWEALRVGGNPHWHYTNQMRMEMNGTMGGAESKRQPTLTLYSPDEDEDEQYHGRRWEREATHIDPILTRWGWRWTVPWEGTPQWTGPRSPAQSTRMGRVRIASALSSKTDTDNSVMWVVENINMYRVRTASALENISTHKVRTTFAQSSKTGNIHVNCRAHTHMSTVRTASALPSETDNSHVGCGKHTHEYSENSVCSTIWNRQQSATWTVLYYTILYYIVNYFFLQNLKQNGC